MRIEISSRHKPVTADTRAYAGKRAQRLLKYYNRIQSIRVVLDSDGDHPVCEMIAELEHMHDLVGRALGEETCAAIDQAADRLERQLVKHKDRTRNRKGRGPNPHQPTRT
ncbi:MAG TPA: ribosome-associated translation inhibitor RaiA [Phycisphaerae bacterium]|nr:ribosome-associated translation inhibitor RaiA [Phycisphaerae bacterium]